MASKTKIEKFGPQNKAQIRGRIGHSRTGACTARGRCYHGFIRAAKTGNRKKVKK